MPSKFVSWRQILANKGWLSGAAPLAELETFCLGSGWAPVEIRSGDPIRKTLRPMTTSEAPAKSLSNLFGLDAQPLHSDGAHLLNPPDFVLLHSVTQSATSTRFWIDAWPGSNLNYEHARHGMFLIMNGPKSFFAPAKYGSRLRYDPGCMIACDERSRKLSSEISELWEKAQICDWDEDDKFLILDNSRALHARSAVAKGDRDRELTRVAYRRKEPST